MIHASFSELRRRLAHFMDRAVDDRAPVLITRQGHEPVVLMAQSDYDSMVQALQPSESAEAFLRRLRAIGPVGDDVIAEVEATIRTHKQPHRGMDL